jgi:hypothetical protein
MSIHVMRMDTPKAITSPQKIPKRNCDRNIRPAAREISEIL